MGTKEGPAVRAPSMNFACGTGRRAAEQREEAAAAHSITSSARASSIGGISMPSACAVIRLMTRSNFVGSPGRVEIAGASVVFRRMNDAVTEHRVTIANDPAQSICRCELFCLDSGRTKGPPSYAHVLAHPGP